MKEPNKIQAETIETCAKLLDWWLRTNDIDSATLDGDIYEELNKLDILPFETESLAGNLFGLLDTIRKL